MGKSSKAPPAPDPNVVASAQAQANKDAILTSAAINRMNEVTPWGNLTYTRLPSAARANPGSAVDPSAVAAWATYDADLRNYNDRVNAMGGPNGEGVYGLKAPSAPTMARPGTPAATPKDPTADIDQWMRRIELNPSGQRQLDLQNALAEALLGKANARTAQITDAPLDFSGLPALPGDFSADRQKVEDALYSRQTSRLDPQFEKAQRDMETRLANQGINIGTEAWASAMDDFNRGRNDAYGGARESAIASAGTEESRLFGLSMQQRQQMINEMLTERSQPWNEISAILQGSPAMQTPQFAPAAQYSMNPADVTGAYQMKTGADTAAFQAKSSADSANFGATTSAAAMMAAAYFF